MASNVPNRCIRFKSHDQKPIHVLHLLSRLPLLGADVIGLNYFVVYCSNLSASKSFYEGLGLSFIPEKHGAGPDHFSCSLGYGTVFELYPNQGSVSRIRLGLRIPGSTPRLVRDPDGNCVEVSC
jgi:hypothetical protein